MEQGRVKRSSGGQCSRGGKKYLNPVVGFGLVWGALGGRIEA